MWQAWLSLIIGVWLIFSGIISDLQQVLNVFISGALLVLFSFFFLKGWEGVVNGFLGIWLVLCGLMAVLITPLNCLMIGILTLIVSGVRVFHIHSIVATKHKTA